MRRAALLVLALGWSAPAGAQGVQERMITGAPAVIVVPNAEPVPRSVPVPTGPRAYPPRPHYFYGDHRARRIRLARR